MRAGGAGIPGFYTKTGVGTQVAEGKEVKNFDGEDYILERGIRADLVIIKGWKADESGNLMFRKTARNFNLPAATCGKVCVAEVEEIVPVGSLDPDCIHLPSIYVKRLILGAPYDKKIEFRTVREGQAADAKAVLVAAADRPSACSTIGAWPPVTASAADLAGIDAAIRGTYDVISGPPGQKRDFDKMRTMFAPGALLRVITPKGIRGGDLEGYIEASGPILEKEGFTEQELGRRTEVYGNLRHGLVVVLTAAPPAAASTSAGINSFQLVKVDGASAGRLDPVAGRGTPVAAPAARRHDPEDEVRACVGTATRWRRARRRSCATAITSTSASASRRWSRTISPRA